MKTLRLIRYSIIQTLSKMYKMDKPLFIYFNLFVILFSTLFIFILCNNTSEVVKTQIIIYLLFLNSIYFGVLIINVKTTYKKIKPRGQRISKNDPYGEEIWND